MAGTVAVIGGLCLTSYFALALIGGGRQARTIAAQARETAAQPVIADWEDDLDAAIDDARRVAARAAHAAESIAYLAFLGSWILALVTAAALSVFCSTCARATRLRLQAARLARCVNAMKCDTSADSIQACAFQHVSPTQIAPLITAAAASSSPGWFMSMVRLPWVAVRLVVGVLRDFAIYAFHMTVAGLPAGLLWLAFERTSWLKPQLASMPLPEATLDDMAALGFAMGQAAGECDAGPHSDADASTGDEDDSGDVSTEATDALAEFRARLSALSCAGRQADAMCSCGSSDGPVGTGPRPISSLALTSRSPCSATVVRLRVASRSAVSPRVAAII